MIDVGVQLSVQSCNFMLLWNPLWLPVVTGYAALMATFSDMPQRQFKDESSEQLTKFRSHGEFKIEHE